MTPNLMQVKRAAMAAGIKLHVCSSYGRKIEAIIYDGVSPPILWQPWLDRHQALDLAQRIGLIVDWKNDQSITVGRKSPTFFVFNDPIAAMKYIVLHAATQTPIEYQPAAQQHINVENPTIWDKGMSNQDIADTYGFYYVEKKSSDRRSNIFYVTLRDERGDKIFDDYFYKYVLARRAMIKFINDNSLQPRTKPSSESTSTETTREVPVPKVLSTQELADKYGFQYVQILDSSGRTKYKVEHCIKGQIYRKEYFNAVDAHMYMIELIKEKNLQPLTTEARSTPDGDTNPSGDLIVEGSIQESLMLFDPATRAEKPYPSSAVQWRNYHGTAAWLYNPWTGKLRDARDIGSDVFGFLIV